MQALLQPPGRTFPVLPVRPIFHWLWFHKDLIKCHRYTGVTRVVNTMTRYSRRETQNSENLLCPEVSVGFLFVFDVSPRLTILIININISALHLLQHISTTAPPTLINTGSRTYYYHYSRTRSGLQKKLLPRHRIYTCFYFKITWFGSCVVEFHWMKNF